MIVVVGATLTHRGTPPDVAVLTPNQLLPFLDRIEIPSPGFASPEAIRHAALQPGTWARQQKSTLPSLGIPAAAWFRELRQRVRVEDRRRTAWILGNIPVALGMPGGIVVLSVLAVVPPH
ncbi:MAG: hypothetical protein H7248_03055 [Microbacteriaceae bacterium]|nr:hypothetical protein [Microbacteriaceae bacterium]